MMNLILPTNQIPPLPVDRMTDGQIPVKTLPSLNFLFGQESFQAQEEFLLATKIY